MSSSRETPIKVRTEEEEKKLMLTIAESAFKMAEENLEGYMDNMVDRAVSLVCDLKRERKYFMEAKEEGADNSLMTRADKFRSTLRVVQNCFNNYDADNAARFVSKYEKADTVLKLLKGEKYSLW